MQVLVTYYSRTGTTEKLAEHVARGVRQVPGVDCVLKPCAEVTREHFLASDAIIVGSPVYFGSMAAELKTVLDGFNGIRKRMEGKIGAAFATSHHGSGGKETTLISIIQAMLIFGMIVVGDPMDAGGHYGVAHAQGEGRAFRDDAAKLGNRVARLVVRLSPTIEGSAGGGRLTTTRWIRRDATPKGRESSRRRERPVALAMGVEGGGWLA